TNYVQLYQGPPHYFYCHLVQRAVLYGPSFYLSYRGRRKAGAGKEHSPAAVPGDDPAAVEGYHLAFCYPDCDLRSLDALPDGLRSHLVMDQIMFCAGALWISFFPAGYLPAADEGDIPLFF